MSSISVQPFNISIAEATLTDLKQRLASVRWPEKETVTDWSQGVRLRAMQELCSYWQHDYDWRPCESWLNSIGQYTTNIDGFDIHFLHIRSAHVNALPMLLMHGWPGSILEFRKSIAPLVDPIRHGGRAEDAFHLVIPSMPGYGFSSKPTTTGMDLRRMGQLYVRLMEGLGYDRWVAQGGDWGADICAKLASENPPRSLAGIHLNFLVFDAEKEIARSRTATEYEQHALAKQQAWKKSEYGYFELQATRPQTIGYSLADSPVGQAAWIYEKLYQWSQHRGNVEEVFTKDEMLDNIMLYWLTNSGASSARLYWEDDDDTAVPVDIPIGATIFPGEQMIAPKMWGERYYSNIVYWNDAEKGGHFAAWEVPEIFVREVRDCFRRVRV